MKFTMGTGGVDGVNGGIRSIFQAITQAPMLQEQMRQQAALRDAQAYHANMTGNKAGAEAQNVSYTLDQRKAVPDLIAGDPSLSPYMQQAYKLFGLTGDTNAHRVAQAGTEVQTQGFRDNAAQQVGKDVTAMNQWNTLAKPGDTYQPFRSVGNTGYSIDQATGAEAEQNPVLAKLFGNQQTALASQRNAAAGASSASAGLSNERKKEIQMGKVQPGMDGDTPILFRAGTNGDVTVMDDLAPYRKGGGSEAAESKARARVVEQVFKDINVLPEDREAEVERRMQMGRGKSPAAPKTDPKMDGEPVQIKDAAGYAKLPKGTKYKDPAGKIRIKG
jgi:hypothetical protein